MAVSATGGVTTRETGSGVGLDPPDEEAELPRLPRGETDQRSTVDRTSPSRTANRAPLAVGAQPAPPRVRLAAANGAVVPMPSAIPLRMSSTFGGLDTLVRTYAPAEEATYRELLQATASSPDPATVARQERQLRDLKTRLLGAVNLTLEGDRRVAEQGGRPFDRLAALKARGLVASEWSLREPGRLTMTAVPKNWGRGANIGRDQFMHRQLPIQAEMILDTRFPVTVIDRANNDVVVFRGEDYGSDARLRGAHERLQERTTQRDGAVRKAEEVRTALAQAEAGVQTATQTVTQADGEIAQARDAVEQATLEAQRTATVSSDAERAATEATRAAQTKREASAEEIKRALMTATSGIDLEVLFATNRADIRPEAKRQLDALGAALTSEEMRGVRVFIDGHTDRRGTRDHNMTLSQRRAEAVIGYLTQRHGVSRDALVARGFGFDRLKDPSNPTADVNRRVQVSVDVEALSPVRRAELEARAAEAQLELETRAAQATQRFVESAEVASRAAEALTSAQAQLAGAQETRRRAVAAQTTAIAERDAQRGALAGAEQALPLAEERVADARRALDEAVPSAEGVAYIRPFGATHTRLDGLPERIAESLAETLTGGFDHLRVNARASGTSVFEGRNPTTGRTLAQDLADEMVRQELAKGTVDVFLERLGELDQLRGGRWLDVTGHRGAGPHGTLRTPLASPREPPRARPLDVEIVVERKPPQEAVLAVEISPATGPDVLPGGEAAREPASSVAGPSQDLTPLTTTVPTQDAVLAAHARHEQALRDLELARRNLSTTTSDARAKRTTAAEIRDALTRPAKVKSYDMNVAFRYDSASIEDPAPLLELGRALTSPELRGRRIQINGHTDATGTDVYNDDLSLRRARAVQQFLVTRFNLRADLLPVQGYGARRLAVPADPYASGNRRVEIMVAD